MHTCIIHVCQLPFGLRKGTHYQNGSMWEYVPLPSHTPTLWHVPIMHCLVHHIQIAVVFWELEWYMYMNKLKWCSVVWLSDVLIMQVMRKATHALRKSWKGCEYTLNRKFMYTTCSHVTHENSLLLAYYPGCDLQIYLGIGVDNIQFTKEKSLIYRSHGV